MWFAEASRFAGVEPREPAQKGNPMTLERYVGARNRGVMIVRAARTMDRRRVGLVAGSCLLVPAAQADPNALWNIVHGQCVPERTAARRSEADAPRSISRAAKPMALRCSRTSTGATQYLLIPTRRMSGIESGALLRPDAANYFADGVAGSET